MFNNRLFSECFVDLFFMLLPNLSFISIYLSKNYVYVRGCNFKLYNKAGRNDDQGLWYNYLSSLLRMINNRNYKAIGRESGVNKQNMQHFMSNSPWESQKVYTQIQREIKETPSLSQGGVLLLDESADEKSGSKSAGAGRQYNGRLGKIDMSQVGVFLAYINLTSHPLWTWVTGDLFLPKHWFAEKMESERNRLGIPWLFGKSS